MSLRPLPVPTRVYPGEGVISYSQRHAARSHSHIADIEHGIRQRGVRLPRTRLSPERLEVWRQLGCLHQTTFSTPASLKGSVVCDRQLCLRCTQGNRAMGRMPGAGMVCLRHKRWLGSPQISLHDYIPALKAERHFCNHLARRDVLFDSFAMELARGCANPVFIGDEEIERRQRAAGISVAAALAYPEQVKFARLLTSRTFLEYATDPAPEARDRRARTTREVKGILPVWDDSESWRVTERIWDVVRRLTELRRESRLWGAPVRDAYYNLLRFIDLPDLVVDDSWTSTQSRLAPPSAATTRSRTTAPRESESATA
jgi:hypothetical protein